MNISLACERFIINLIALVRVQRNEDQAAATIYRNLCIEDWPKLTNTEKKIVTDFETILYNYEKTSTEIEPASPNSVNA